MPTAYYLLPADSPAQTISTATKQRAVALECVLCIGDPTGKVTAFPSAVVISTVVTFAPAIFPDTALQATLTEVKAAVTAAAAAEAKVVTNTTTLQTRAKTAVANNLSWLTAAAGVTYPLTVTEQKSLVNHVEALTRQMDAVIKLMLELVQTLTGT